MSALLTLDGCSLAGAFFSLSLSTETTGCVISTPARPSEMLWRPINDQFNLAKFALKKYFQGEEHAIKLAESKLHGITAHSARVTLLDAAVHAGRSTEEIGLQANWKNPGPLVLKYTRNRTSLPAQMVQQLVKDMVDHSHPFEVPLDAVLDDGAETSFDEVGGTSVVACGRLTIEECTETGSVLPDPSLLCKRCALARPDVVSRSVETFAMLGDTIAMVKQTIKTTSQLAGPLKSLVKTMLNSERRSSPGTPMWSFQSIVSHTASSWSESKRITSSTVLFTSMTASSETQVMDKLHPFFITLEYLNTCEFSFKAGPLKYLAELEEWRHENRGLALLLAADSLIRKKVHRVSSDQPKKFSTFSAALLEAKKNRNRCARQKAQLQQAKAVLAKNSDRDKPDSKKPSRDARGTAAPCPALGLAKGSNDGSLSSAERSSSPSSVEGITGAVQLAPIDIVLSDMVKEVSDVVDAQVWQRVVRVLREGVVFYLHCGTPCNTVSSARKDDVGQPPLRSLEYQMGLPDLLVSLFLITVTYVMDNLIFHARALAIDLEQCAFGAPSRETIRLECSNELFDPLAINCPGGHDHIQLKGKVTDPTTAQCVFKTKAAQVYPWVLCAAFASVVHALWQDPFQHLQASFQLVTPAMEAATGLQQAVAWPSNVLSGPDISSSVVQPSRSCTLKWRKPYASSSDRRMKLFNIEGICSAVGHRSPLTCCRNLCKPFASYRMLREGRSLAGRITNNQFLVRFAMSPCTQPCSMRANQLTVLCLSCSWKAFPLWAKLLAQDIPVREALGRAWAIRRKIIQRVAHVPVTENLQKIWEASIEDVQECSCLGPFSQEAQVTEILGCEDWIPTQRFEVVQKNKVRGCDSATTNMINQVTKITEKLQLPSTVTNVAALRMLRSIKPDEKLAGWVLDELKAYRQVAVRPDHRKFSVICLKNPKSGAPNSSSWLATPLGSPRPIAVRQLSTSSCVSLFGLVGVQLL
ncbi:unnamed protein product [Cladocopium goreaui]|uniref:Uncharacterized protein n=1 Tax=Cladocopium goreaui TaxID=2562237 RepID=A0A9P1BMV1_9DINO|nr:unnamed protein product [Cladocopium goreaui]